MTGGAGGSEGGGRDGGGEGGGEGGEGGEGAVSPEKVTRVHATPVPDDHGSIRMLPTAPKPTLTFMLTWAPFSR